MTVHSSAGMATNLHENLQKGGASLHVHNRTESKAKSLIDKGAIWESSPAEIAKKCRFTFSSMFADEGLKSTFQAWLNGKPQKGSIYVDSSTVYPGTAKELTKEAEKAGKALVPMLQLVLVPCLFSLLMPNMVLTNSTAYTAAAIAQLQHAASNIPVS